MEAYITLRIQFEKCIKKQQHHSLVFELHFEYIFPIIICIFSL